MDSATQDMAQIRVPSPDGALEQALADLDAKLAAWKAAMLDSQDQLLQQARAQAEAQEGLEAQARQQAEAQEQLQVQVDAQAQAQQQVRAQAEEQAQAEQQLKAQAEAQARTQQQLKAKAEAQAQTETQAPAKQQVKAKAQSRSAEKSEQPADAQPEVQAQPAATLQSPNRNPSQARPGAGTKAAEPPASMPANVPGKGEEWAKHIRVPAGSNPPATLAPDSKAQSPASGEDEEVLASLDPETAQAIRIMRRMSAEKKSVRELLEQYQASQAAGKSEPQKKSWFRRGK
jgi:fused signal recognition particle receptor